MKYLKYILGFVYSIYLNLRGIKISPLARITPDSKFEGMNSINRGVVFMNSFLGRGSYINNSSTFFAAKIGRYCSIGANVNMITGRHPLDKNVSTHPSFYSLKKQAGFTFAHKQLVKEHKLADEENGHHLVIENDVWIGSNVLLLSGITIKTGAVIATGSVVTTDVEPYSIIGGVPAKKIRMRFSEKEIDYLLSSKWWDKPVDWIKQNYESFLNLNAFKAINELNNR